MSKRKILFIGVGFHSYDKLIVKELEKTSDVSYVNSCLYQQKHKSLYYVTGHLKQMKLWNKLCANNILQQVNIIKEPYFDVLFVIRGQYLTKEIIDFLITKYKIKKKIIYLWDSYDNHKNLSEIISEFDKIYSFDSNDCRNKGFKLRPLFYFEDNKQITEDIDDRKYYVSFVGGDHSERYEFISSFKDLCIKNNFEYKFYLLIGVVSFFIFKFFPLFSRYKKYDGDVLAASSISYEDYIDILNNSKVVIDMPYSNQCGLTMRTIEALSKGIKIITTNKNIIEYKDIPKELYLVLNENTDDDTIIRFLKEEKGNTCIPESYSCREALKEMLD